MDQLMLPLEGVTKRSKFQILNPKCQGRVAQMIFDTSSRTEVPNAQTTLGHLLLRYVIPPRDLRSPNGATGNSQGRKPLESGTPGKEPCKGGTERKDFGVPPLQGSTPELLDYQGLAPLAISCRPVGAQEHCAFRRGRESCRDGHYRWWPSLQDQGEEPVKV